MAAVTGSHRQSPAVTGSAEHRASARGAGGRGWGRAVLGYHNGPFWKAHLCFPSAGVTLWIQEGVSEVCLLEVRFLFRFRATARSVRGAGVRGDDGSLVSLQVAAAVLQRMLAGEPPPCPAPKLA